MKQQVQDILDSFLPAMAQIQAGSGTDENKKHMAKEWLRKRLQVFLSKEAVGKT
jgi:hypothetical protein